MKNLPKKSSTTNIIKAYTLIELSIVISIIAVLMVGALGISISVVNTANKSSSKVKLDKIYDAIGKFLLTNKRLPCPASLTLTTSNSNYGMEVGNGGGCSGSGVFQSTTSTNIFYGMVPVRALGLAPDMGYDDFGGKISYIIDQRFTRNFQEVPNFSNPSFGTVDTYNNSMIIREKPSSVSRDITQGAVLVMVSHSLNKFGAFNRDSAVQNAISTDADEQNNHYSASFDNIFVISAQNSNVFDDIVFYKTRNQIVEDYSAYNLIACRDAGAIFGNKNAYYGQNVYATSQCASLSYTKIAEKYCDRFGNWHDINKCENW